MDITRLAMCQKMDSAIYAGGGCDITRLAMCQKMVGDSGDDGNWLFKDEYISGMRSDLPAPVGGESYTMFLNGGEIATATAQLDGYLAFMGAGVCFCHESDKWIFNTDVPEGWEVTEGTVSIRINTPSGEWRIVNGDMCHIENGYLYADAEPMYVTDGVRAHSFMPDEPLNLMALDTTKTYEVWSDIGGFCVATLVYVTDNGG